jgi:ribonuclease P protein component
MTLSKQGIRCNLVSVQPSARAQSVLAAGGINGAINVMGEDDKPEYHEADTMKAGVFIADPEAVKGLTHHAPDILRLLMRLGVPFNMKDGHIIQRNFGGQKKKRTAYAKSSTGKIIMSVLIDEVRKYEAQGLVTRYQNHEFRRLYAKGRSAVMPSLVIYVRPNKSGDNRVGFTVTTRLGHAVVRNRIHRRLREIYRLHREELRPGTDMVVVARGRSVEATYRRLEQDFLAACRKLNLLEEGG